MSGREVKHCNAQSCDWNKELGCSCQCKGCVGKTVSVVSQPGNAIEILTQDRDEWKARCLAAEAERSAWDAQQVSEPESMSAQQQRAQDLLYQIDNGPQCGTFRCDVMLTVLMAEMSEGCNEERKVILEVIGNTANHVGAHPFDDTFDVLMRIKEYIAQGKHRKRSEP